MQRLVGFYCIYGFNFVWKWEREREVSWSVKVTGYWIEIPTILLSMSYRQLCSEFWEWGGKNFCETKTQMPTNEFNCTRYWPRFRLFQFWKAACRVEKILKWYLRLVERAKYRFLSTFFNFSRHFCHFLEIKNLWEFENWYFNRKIDD